MFSVEQHIPTQHYIIIKFLAICLLPVFSSEEMIAGIDVSHWNRVNNWTEVAKSGIKFAFAKGTQGKTYFDQTFVQNWNSIVNNGMTAGAYHFFSSDVSAEDQLNNIRNNIINKVNFSSSPQNMLAVDFETNSAQLNPKQISELLITLLKMIESEFNLSPVIYTGPNFWQTTIGEMATVYPFNSYRLWIAHYSTKPTIPKPWDRYYIWQHTDKGKVEGIQGYVDLDWINSSINPNN